MNYLTKCNHFKSASQPRCLLFPRHDLKQQRQLSSGDSPKWLFYLWFGILDGKER